MEILAAYDLTRSYRDAAKICGVSHNTVRSYVQARQEGAQAPVARQRGRMTDPFLPQMISWVEQSRGKIRGDVVHEKLVALGFTGCERTTRTTLAELKAKYRARNVRVHRPWTPEPGLWLQYDYGDGPIVDGVKTVLFVAWLAFSRFRIVIALRDKTMPSVFAALDRCFRILGGAPTYVLTDNEKTVTTGHVAGVPVRNQQTLDFARHYGISVLTCQPADPATKGGVEASVKLAKADLVPTDTNLRSDYSSFAELEAACQVFMDEVNNREHRATRRKPAAVLAEESPRLHRIPETAHTVAFGLARTVPENTPMVTFENAQYSVPAHLLGSRVFVRSHGTGPDEQVVIVHHGDAGPVEVARHGRARPGSPAVIDEHFPGTRTRIPGDYAVKARNAGEAEFLAIGEGARTWLLEAAAAGTGRMNVKMAESVTLAKIAGAEAVDRALGDAALYGRFAHGDLASILNANVKRITTHSADETRSLTQGTGAWAGLGAGSGAAKEQSR